MKDMGEMAQARIEIAEYDPEWPSKFEKEKSLLVRKLGNWLKGNVEHVGSTAVPGLSAKPVIDIMFGVESLEKSRPAIELAQELGYCYFPYKAEVMHWFCKPSDSFRTHHLHMIPFESALWKDRLAFRDALRLNPELAADYKMLKLQLAEKYSDDRERYTDEKGPFIEQVLAGVR